MAISFVQEKHDFTFGVTHALTYTSNVTAGNLLIAFLANNIAGTLSVADSQLNSWAIAAGPVAGGYAIGGLVLAFAIAGSTGADTVTFSTTGAGFTTTIMQIAEFAGSATTAPQDGAGVTATSGGTNTPTINITTGVANDLVIGACNPASGSTETGGSGWTQLGGSASYGMIYQVVTSAATYSPNYSQSNSGAWGMVAAAFKIKPNSAAHYSVPDCRISYCGLVPTTHLYPNGSRNVNGTLIYDVETSNNPAIPPTDSRAAGAPTASGTYPQNSRTPGTYGPGE
jgi:hypothetical protein